MKKKIWIEIAAILVLAVIMGVVYNQMATKLPYIYKEKVLEKAESFDTLFHPAQSGITNNKPDNPGLEGSTESQPTDLIKEPVKKDANVAENIKENNIDTNKSNKEEKAGNIKNTEQQQAVSPGNENKKDSNAVSEAKVAEQQKKLTAEDIFKRTIDYKQLKAKLNDPLLYLIDARSPESFKKSHIPHAVNIYPYMPEEKYYRLLSMVPEHRVIVVYCDGGLCDLSHDVIRALIDFGYQKIFLYSGGWEDWTKNHGEITK